MLQNYIKIAWLNIKNHKVYAFINIFGLAIGLLCFLFIAIYVVDELSYDRYPTNAKNIYRVNLSVPGNGDVAVYPNVDFAVGPGMTKEFPEIKSFTRMSLATDFIRYEDVFFKEDKLAFADSNFLQLFSIPLVKGNDQNALVQPNSIVISNALAKKYFGNQDPIGKSMVVGLRNALYKVTGVFDKVPDNSHFHLNAVMSLSTFNIPHPTWSNIGEYTYLELNDQVDVKKLEAKFPQLVQEHVVPEVQRDMGISLAEAQKSVNTFVFTLQPLTDIHLHSNTKYELEPNGDYQNVYIFFALAGFILLLACINFTNLSIARSIKRAKEIGVRKVLGSEKIQLIKQFLSESVLMSLCAMLVALILAYVLLPYYNQLSGKVFSIEYFYNYQFLISVVSLILLIGLTSGIYPAFYLSAFNPIKVLKGSKGTGNAKSPLRNGLIVFQFFISTALIGGTIIIQQQLKYLQNKKLGYDQEQVLFLPDGRLMGDKQDAYKQLILQDNRVVSASISRVVPGDDDFIDGTQVFPVSESGPGTEIHMNIYHVDYDYLQTLGMEMKEGRYFSLDHRSDSSAAVINEAAVKELGWNHIDPIGKSIVRSGQQEIKIVGVVKDFNYTSAKHEVAPLMMLLGGNYGGLIVKIKTDDVRAVLSGLKAKWNSLNPTGPMSYTFLDDKFAALYTSEIRMQKIFSIFSILAIVIASLGLFGLSSFMIEQRTKEIGVRKVLGATTSGVAIMLSKEFIRLILIAIVLATPLVYFFMNKWLQTFAYRTELQVWVFIWAGMVSVLIGVITVSFQAIKAALMNPVKSLKSE